MMAQGSSRASSQHGGDTHTQAPGHFSPKTQPGANLEPVQQEMLSRFLTALLVIEKQLERAPVFLSRKRIHLSRNSGYRTPRSSEEK